MGLISKFLLTITVLWGTFGAGVSWADSEAQKCLQLNTNLESYLTKSQTWNLEAVKYLESLAQVMKDWHSRFSLLEGKENTFAKGQFEGVHQTVAGLLTTVDQINEHFGLLADQMVEILDGLGPCLAAASDLPQGFEKYNDDARKQEGAVSLYFSGLSSRLSQWDQALTQLEGQTKALKTGYFASLANLADDAVEATGLMAEVFSQLSRRLDKLKAQLAVENPGEPVPAQLP